MRKQLHIIFRLVMFSCILLFVSQEASAQITFSVKNQTIRQTIRVIEKKADYSFFYTDKLPGLDQKISLIVNNESIDSVLEKVFKGSSISYKIESGKQVVLTLKSEQNAPQKGDKKTITGVVADRRGEPLIGVTVRVEGENIGTATDIDGRFSLEAPVGAKVSFSYIGYVSQSHTVNKQNVYNVSLSEDSQVLEEVVVVGYGSMKRKDITTAVSVVSTADIEERPIMTAAPQPADAQRQAILDLDNYLFHSVKKMECTYVKENLLETRNNLLYPELAKLFKQLLSVKTISALRLQALQSDRKGYDDIDFFRDLYKGLFNGFDPQSAVSYEQMDIQLICLEAWLDIMQEATEHNSIKKRLTNELHSLHDRLEELSTIHSQKEVRDMYILLLRRMEQYFRVVS